MSYKHCVVLPMLVYHSQLLVHIEFGTGTLTGQPKGDQFFLAHECDVLCCNFCQLVHIEFGTSTLTSQPKGDQLFWYMSVRSVYHQGTG